MTFDTVAERTAEVRDAALQEIAGPAPAAARAGTQQLSFRLAAEEYAFDILRVREIRGHARPTRLPDMPPHLQGVIDLRGTIVPVIDLRTRLGLVPTAAEATAVTIVLDVGDDVLGVVVDAVSDVVNVPPDTVRPVPRLGPSDAAHLIGMATLRDGDRDRLLILLDAERLTSDVRSPRHDKI